MSRVKIVIISPSKKMKHFDVKHEYDLELKKDVQKDLTERKIDRTKEYEKLKISRMSKINSTKYKIEDEIM